MKNKIKEYGVVKFPGVEEFKKKKEQTSHKTEWKEEKKSETDPTHQSLEPV